MKRFTSLLAAAGSALLTAPTPVAVPQEAEFALTAPAPKPRVEFYNHPYEGVVTAVTDRSITIRGSGYKHPGERERRFPYDRGLDLYQSWHGFHRLADIRVGDKVGGYITRVEGIDYCVYVAIMRRPGGRVPPTVGEERLDMKFSEMMNAYQDLEERGIPLPKKYDFEAANRAFEEKRAKLGPRPW